MPSFVFPVLSRFRTALLPTLALALVLAVAPGCDSGSPGDPPEDDDPIGPPSSVEVTFADDAAFVVDSTVGVQATVTDADGRPVEGASVTWMPAQGSTDPAADTTDEDGISTTNWTLGTQETGEEAQEIGVTVEGQNVSTARSVNVNPGPVAALAAAAADSAIAVDSTTSVSATDLRDAFDNQIDDLSPYTFTWTSLDTDVATVSSESSSSAAVTGKQDGEARIVVSTGGAPNASLAGIAKAEGAVSDTVVIDVRRHELRGVWLTTTDSRVLNSRDNIEEAMQFLADHNFNVVFPVVWNQAGTTYPSTVMDTLIGRPIKSQFEGRDPLQELIEEAHARDIAVIPWFEFGFASSYALDGGPIIDKYPSWAAKDRNGDLLTKNGFEWLNPYKPAVQDFMMALILEVVDNYDVDGVQGDDRLPANPVEGGYSDHTKQLYRSEHDGQDPPTDIQDPEWMRWRADKLNAFGKRLYDEVKAEDEDLIVSWSPSVWNFSFREYLQDWPTWINDGFTDLMHPQVYRRDVGSYQATLDAQSPSSAGWDPSQIVGFYPGILLKVGGFVATPEDILTIVDANRQRGYNGEVYFFYEGLREYNADVATALKDGPYADPAPLPFPMASETP